MNADARLDRPGGRRAGLRVLRVGIATPVHGFDPHDVMDQGARLVLFQVFEAPCVLGADCSAAPLVFEDLPRPSVDGTAYSAGIRSDVRFSDGTPVTPDHVVRSFVRGRALGDDVTVEARHGGVVFRLPRPNPRLALLLSELRCSIVLDVDNELLGTGPYAIAPDTTPDCIRLVRNRHYRRPFAIDEIVLRSYARTESGDSDALLRALARGDVDFTMALSRDEVGRAPRFRKLFQPGSSTAALFLNCERGVFREAEARRTVGLAIDRYALTRLSYSNPAAFAARSWLPPSMSVPFSDGLHFDPRGARAKLPAFGIPGHARLRMLVVWGPRPYLPHPERVARAVKAQLADVGLAVEIVAAEDSADYHGQLQQGEYDLALGGWIADTPDPIDFLEATLGSGFVPLEGRPTTVTCNLSRWNDTMVDALLAECRGRGGGDTIQQILTRVGAEVPLLPLMYGPVVIIHDWRLRNFEPSSINLPRFVDLDFADE